MGIFDGLLGRSKKPQPRAKGVSASGRGGVSSARAPSSGARQGAVAGARAQAVADARDGDESREILKYGDVPTIIAVLSSGDKPIITLDEGQKRNMVVIEGTGRRATILHTRSYANSSAVNSVRGSLRSDKYQSVDVCLASEDVITKVYNTALGKTAESDEMKLAQQNAYSREIRRWIEYGISQRATDIHIETSDSHGHVRFRVDGDLEAMRTPDRGENSAQFLIKCMSMLYNMQKRKSGSDSMFQEEGFTYCMVPYAEIPGNEVKLRFQGLKGERGPKVVARLLPVGESAKTLTFEQLGYESTQIEMWHRAMETPSGMVLIAGITGSGKSTTQKSFIELNPDAPKLAIFTIEDPVEYPIRYAHQIPIQRDLSNHAASGKAFGEATSSLMRADPDVAMLGEIRDKFSANAAQQLAETGHMALGTVHAHLLSGITPRLTNPEIGMNREVLTAPNMLTLMVYQALVPVLCGNCSFTTEQALASGEGIRHYVDYLRQLGIPLDTLRWKNPNGCSHCNGRGTTGQTVVAEMLMPSDDWLKAIRAHDDALANEVYISESDHDLASMNTKGKTVFEHTMLKALSGMVDVRQCSRFDNFQRYVQRRLRRLRQVQDVANVPSGLSAQQQGMYEAVLQDLAQLEQGRQLQG